MSKVNILGTDVDDVSCQKAVSTIVSMATVKKRGQMVVTVNSEFVMMARRNTNFANILANSDLAVADGAGVVLAKLILGGKEKDRITGVDLIKMLCVVSAKKAIVVGFLGGFGGVAAEVAKRQKTSNPGLKVAIAESGNPTISHDLRLDKRLSQIGRIDILFVAYGMGQQEFWIARNKNKLDVGVFIGVGGALDYLAGVKKRAPKYWQMIGMEWFWRLIWEPKRVWRMRVLPLFMVLVLVQKIRNF